MAVGRRIIYLENSGFLLFSALEFTRPLSQLDEGWSWSRINLGGDI